ncbi:MAG: GGDEF domain-containing protein [bacterium]|nr:GGDEF domain-containing protein [bacterium]
MINPESINHQPSKKRRVFNFTRLDQHPESAKTAEKSQKTTSPESMINSEEEQARDQEILEFLLLQRDAQDQSEKPIRGEADPKFQQIWQEVQAEPRFQKILAEFLQPSIVEELQLEGKGLRNWLKDLNHPLFVAILENIYRRILQEKVNAKHVRDQEKTPLLQDALATIIPEVNAEKRSQIVEAVRQLFVGINPEDDVHMFEASLDKERKYQMILDSENQYEGLKRAFFRFNAAAGRNRDTLTGAWNRHAFHNYLEVVTDHDQGRFTLKSQEKRPQIIGYAVTAFDFDHFKQINDTYGHEAGDDALKAVTDAFKQSAKLRNFDFLFRQGGDEWALIMPLTNVQDVNKIFNRIISIFREISQQFVDLPIRNKKGEIIKRTITFSAGTRVLFMDRDHPQDEDSLQDYLNPNNADNELYQSKEQSRNRITLSYRDENGEIISKSAILNQEVGAIS